MVSRPVRELRAATAPTHRDRTHSHRGGPAFSFACARQLCLDNSGLYVATSCTDKTLAVYDYYSGDCMATMYGHSELVTGLRFTNDGRHLISVSGDGCVFVWKLPHDMTVTVLARLGQQTQRQAKENRRATYSAHRNGANAGASVSPDFKVPTPTRS